ncbi:hypothetical protein CC2G_012287 [Coprinopsis cinerea AmutBmut pab1-1]|nr:hypothetical protein CC2G_012287 [Coprinopsis cinerea AmutBmut pab1-1]
MVTTRTGRATAPDNHPHAVFHNHELIEQIIGWTALWDAPLGMGIFGETRDDQRTLLNKADLLSLALVCKAFEEPALNLIWRSINSIGPLLEMVPTVHVVRNPSSKCNYYLLGDDVAPDAWVRFSKYNTRVRHFTLSYGRYRDVLTPQIIRKLIERFPPTLPFFPRLRSITVLNKSTVAQHLFQLLLASRITDVCIEPGLPTGWNYGALLDLADSSTSLADLSIAFRRTELRNLVSISEKFTFKSPAFKRLSVSVLSEFETMTDTIAFCADSPITSITPILLCLDSSATEDQISRIVSPFLRTGKTSLVFKGLFEERNIRPFSLEERIPLHAISRGCTTIDIDFRQKQVRRLMYRFMEWNIDFITNATNMRQLTVRLPTTWRYHLSPEDVLALAKLPLLQDLTLEGCISPFEDFNSLDGFVEQLERAFSSKAVPLRVCRLPRIASTAPGADEPAPQLGFWALTVLAECLSVSL